MSDIYCWSCGERIPEESVFCKFCGKDVSRGAAVSLSEDEFEDKELDPAFDDDAYWDIIREEFDRTDDPKLWNKVLNNNLFSGDSNLAMSIYERPLSKAFSLTCAYNAIDKTSQFIPILVTDHMLIIRKKASAFSAGSQAIIAARDTSDGCEVLISVGRQGELFEHKSNQADLEEIVNAWIDVEVAEAERLLAEMGEETD